RRNVISSSETEVRAQAATTVSSSTAASRHHSSPNPPKTPVRPQTITARRAYRTARPTVRAVLIDRLASEVRRRLDPIQRSGHGQARASPQPPDPALPLLPVPAPAAGAPAGDRVDEEPHARAERGLQQEPRGDETGGLERRGAGAPDRDAEEGLREVAEGEDGTSDEDIEGHLHAVHARTGAVGADTLPPSRGGTTSVVVPRPSVLRPAGSPPSPSGQCP